MDHTTKNLISQILEHLENYEDQSKTLSDQGKIILAENTLKHVRECCEGRVPSPLQSLAEQTNEIYKKKILLVDDDTPTLQVLQIALRKNGYHTVIESNPFDAIKNLPKLLPDLIILDLMMPQMTGFEFLQQIRSKPEYDNVKIIIGSTRSHKEDLAQIFKSGADEYIPKPFDLGKMQQVIEELLELKNAS